MRRKSARNGENHQRSARSRTESLAMLRSLRKFGTVMSVNSTPMPVAGSDSPDHGTKARSFADIHCELNFAASGSGLRCFNEAAIQADRINRSGHPIRRAGNDSRRYLAGDAAETSSFLLIPLNRRFFFFSLLNLRRCWSTGDNFRFLALNADWLRTAIKAFIAINAVKRMQPE